MENFSFRSSARTKPRLIIHGGAGNISRANLPPKSWASYKANLLRIYHSTNNRLDKGETALDVVTHAVTLFEDCDLFNCGKGAVFTRSGTIELEASIMTTRGYHKRACGVVLLKHVKNPIKLACEMLVRGQTDSSSEDSNSEPGELASGSKGAQGHVCLGGDTAERLAKGWGLELVDEEYFWTRKRWEEHRRGLGQSQNCERESGLWDNHEYLPQGTVGAVALDQYGTICVATSTGGLTNKLPCRIGDTPTIGAGFWAEEWSERPLEKPLAGSFMAPTVLSKLVDSMPNLLADCIPFALQGAYRPLSTAHENSHEKNTERSQLHSLAVSGTGNGDSFLRLAAARTVGAIVRFSANALPPRNLASAMNQIVGAAGEMQRSAGEWWGNGDGEGGMIGIELKDGEGQVVYDFNCGGLFRCWGDGEGKVWVGAFRNEDERDEGTGR